MPPATRSGNQLGDPCEVAGGGGKFGLGAAGDARSSDDAQLSKAARLMEEDRKTVASIRSFLLNFLEERDCSIKKRLVRVYLLVFRHLCNA